MAGTCSNRTRNAWKQIPSANTAKPMRLKDVSLFPCSDATREIRLGFLWRPRSLSSVASAAANANLRPRTSVKTLSCRLPGSLQRVDMLGREPGWRRAATGMGFTSISLSSLNTPPITLHPPMMSIWHLEAPAPARFCISGGAQYLWSAFSRDAPFCASQERGCPSGHIADAISSTLDVIPELTTIKKADLWALG